MALRVPFDPVLDGGLVDIGDGSASKRSIRIEAGEYATPFWLRTESGLVIPVTELPWQGVVDDAELEVLSEAPGGGGGPGPELLLEINWTTALGTSDAAVSDGAKGDVSGNGVGGTAALWGCPSTMSVVSGASVGLPSGFGNAFKITYGSSGCGHLQFPHVFPLPANGEDQFWACRAYYMNEAGQTASEQHPHCLWPTGVGGGAIEGVHCAVLTSGGLGDWYPGNNLMGEMPSSPFPFGVYPKTLPGGSIIVLTRDLWYRYEWIMHWRSATEFRVYPRLYDSDDATLLADSTNYCHSDTTESLQDWYDADPDNWFTRRSSSPDPNNIRTLSWGNGQAFGDGVHGYFVGAGAVALVDGIDNFIGAYIAP